MLFTAHALLIEGGSAMTPLLCTLLREGGEAAQGDVDYFERVYDAFGVDDARDIAARTATRPTMHARRVFVLVSPTLTVEAQNALLKTIEEPLSPSLMVIITSRPQSLLPTLRSRMHVYRMEDGTEDTAGPVFINASLEKRLEQIKLMLGKDADERDMSVIHDFLTSLEKTLAKGNLKTSAKALQAVYRAKRYVADKGALVKSLLEQLAYLIPTR